MKRFILCLLLASLLPASAQSSYQDAVQALQARDDTAALQITNQLEEKGEGSYGLYYNRGLAYRNLNQPGRARASFEKALTYSPRSLEARRRLREMKDKLSPDLAEDDVRGTPWWTRTEGSLLLLVSALAVLGLGVARFLGRAVTPRQIGAATAVFLLLTGLLAWNNPAARRGVVVSSTAKLLAKPEGGSSGPALQDGLMVRVLEEKGHFVRVGTHQGQSGWVRNAEIVEI